MTARIITDAGIRSVLAADPKPSKRIKASAAGWKTLRAEKLDGCRICERKCGDRLELHHLVPRGMGGTVGGDDVADNLVCLCGRCHGLIEGRDPWAASLLGSRLTVAERAYVVEKKGAYYLASRYGIKEDAA